MKESHEPEIVIPDWSYVAYLAMLEFLYTGSVYDLKADVRCRVDVRVAATVPHGAHPHPCMDGSTYVMAQVALELMGLADHSALDGLKALCESTLVHNVDVENVCTLFSRAHRCQVRRALPHTPCPVHNPPPVPVPPFVARLCTIPAVHCALCTIPAPVPAIHRWCRPRLLHDQAGDLKKYCLDFIFKNFETVTRTKAFDALGAEPTLLLEVTRESISRSSRR